jgi:hypothetical protein
MTISSSIKPGDIVTRKHKRPQSRRHGVVVEVFMKDLISVKFHGSVKPVILPLSKLDFGPEK